MITKLHGKWEILNCYPKNGDTDIILADYNKKRRDLFNKGVFEIRKNPAGYFELRVNGGFITFWFPYETARIAKRAISVAYHTYKSMGGERAGKGGKP